MSRWTELRNRIARWLLDQVGYYDLPAPSSAPSSSSSAPPLPAGSPAAPAPTGAGPGCAFGLASCWDGANAKRRMMNVLSPKMSDARFREYVAWMLARGCDTAHVILANQGDGECAGYAAWRDADYARMLARLNDLRAAGLVTIPWIVTDDSAALLKELFAKPAELVGRLAIFLAGSPLVVLGLEMDEDKSVTVAQWKAVRDAVRRVYDGPIGVHHKSGNGFPAASLGEVVLGQLDPGCTAAQVKAQIAAIKRLGKRAIGFEYARGPKRDLAQAALDAGAEGCGNW